MGLGGIVYVMAPLSLAVAAVPSPSGEGKKFGARDPRTCAFAEEPGRRHFGGASE